MTTQTLARTIDGADLRELARNAGWTRSPIGWVSPYPHPMTTVEIRDGAITVTFPPGADGIQRVITDTVTCLADVIAVLVVARLLPAAYLDCHTCASGGRCHACDLDADRAAERRADQ